MHEERLEQFDDVRLPPGLAGVFGTGTGWPDVIVAAIMASLALQGAWLVVNQSLKELRPTNASPPTARSRAA
jgi:Co/Zn/Cd efflux system component